ncbi:MAG: hypothetical protein WCI63_02900 [bacterium]
MPDKIKTARVCILVGSWINVVLAAIMLVLFLMSGALIGVSGDSGSAVGGLIFGIFGVVIALLLGVSALVGFMTAKGIREKKNWAKIVGIIIAILNVTNVPIGTILGVLILIGLFDSESSAWFEK